MTKEEAIAAMNDGKKVKHRYFDKGEYIFIENGIMYDENGYVMRPGIFWQDRNGAEWQVDWEAVT